MKLVYDVCGSIDIPIIGVGGVSTAADILEYALAGATAVQVGTANFINPAITEKLANELAGSLGSSGIKTFSSIIGAAKKSR
jgi:dihydroorotate dehydrogenase (NAD+) catalytic subunit